MLAASILKLLHPRRRGFLIRVALGAVLLILIALSLKTRRAHDNSQPPEGHDKNVRMINKAGQEPIGVIISPVESKAVEKNAHKKFNVDARTDEERLLDDEIEFMNRKVVAGLGEHGKGVELVGEEKSLADSLMKKEAFNILASDRISYSRSVPDNRNEKCKEVKYPEDLPSVSVIIIFTNEAWSPLLRTVHSVLNRSPEHLLHEIILLDDFSDRLEMKRRLERYVELNFPKKVKIIRAKERLGLIRARLAGAKVAAGEVLLFLDSHCEVNVGWLEPLLARIKENRKVALVPIIEVIDDNTMHYYSSGSDFFQIGSFTWSGHFTWINIPQREIDRRGSSINPTRSATMAGGLFAMEKNYFWEIGGYDEGMDVWGGENLEMSFRVWMCGGYLETIPCSRVGHIFRSFHPYTFPGNKDTHGLNTARMAEVWMDEYKRLFYMYRPELQTADYGSVTERKEFRKRLQCNDFKWYLENVVPEKFILDEDSWAFGRVRNGHDLCLDFLQKDEDNDYELGVYICHTTVAMSQYFSFSKNHELRRESMCASASFKSSVPEEVVMTQCSLDDSHQQWKLNVNGPIIHKKSGRCLDSYNSTSLKNVWVIPCDGSETQRWKFDSYVAGNKELNNL